MASVVAKFAVAAAALFLPIAAARAEPAIWTVHDKDSTIVLFGSFHILPPRADWRPAALDRALASADDVWFEIPLDDAATLQAQHDALAHSLLPRDQSLSALLSPAGRRRLALVARKLGAAPDVLDRMQPWYAETVLGVAYYRRQGALSEQGVERQIAETLPSRIRQRAFETVDQQIAMFAHAGLHEQAASLEDSLKQFEDDPDFMPRILKLWLAGDVDRLNRVVLDHMRRTDPVEYRTLIAERNRAWLPVILDRLAGSGTTVVVVGAGHLVGPDGLPALLRRRGIKVDGP